MFFSDKTNYPIGLDISDLSLKLVQLKKTGDKIKIQALSKIKLAPGIFEKGELINNDKAIKAIRELIERPSYGKITSQEVIACLPETKTFIKLIELPKNNGSAADLIESEIEKHVPLSISEIYYDWQLIENLPEKQTFLIGAAPRSIVNQYTELLDKAKLTVSAMEIEPISICRSLLAEEYFKYKGEKNKNYGIIDIGAKRSSFTVYSKNTILFSFSLPISGEEITNKISSTLKIETSQAEKAKIICGLDEIKADGIIKNSLHGMIKELVSKINESISYFTCHFNERGPIDEVLLSGGGSNIKNLDKIISDYINLKVSMGDVLKNLNEEREKLSEILSETIILNKKILKENKKEKVTQDTSSSYATAIGLALRGVFTEKI